MKKTRGKSLKAKKYISFMIVPHNSDKIIKWKIANVYSKLFVLLALFIIVVLAFSGYLAVTIHENKELRKAQEELYTFISEQRNIVEKNLSVISEAENLDSITKEKIDEFALQVSSLTQNYIDKEIKTLTVSRSSALSNPSVSFVGKIAELKAILNFLEQADIKEDELLSELSEIREDLREYLNYMPTIWPTEGIIESGYGNRLHPIYRKFMEHTGVDIGGKNGNPIYSAASGTVIAAGKNGGYGYCVDIDHGNGLVTRYAHCSKIMVRKWQKVKAGEEIAKVGNTGTTTGPHLHFEIRLYDRPIDPIMFIGKKP
jgi:murein DD-endopeptidase MepM/ murein hydrolase activator NlpD